MSTFIDTEAKPYHNKSWYKPVRAPFTGPYMVGTSGDRHWFLVSQAQNMEKTYHAILSDVT